MAVLRVRSSEFEFGVRDASDGDSDGDHFAPRVCAIATCACVSPVKQEFLVSPTREEQTVVAMSACARKQTVVSQATPFAVYGTPNATKWQQNCQNVRTAIGQWDLLLSQRLMTRST